MAADEFRKMKTKFGVGKESLLVPVTEKEMCCCQQFREVATLIIQAHGKTRASKLHCFWFFLNCCFNLVEQHLTKHKFLSITDVIRHRSVYCKTTLLSLTQICLLKFQKSICFISFHVDIGAISGAR